MSLWSSSRFLENKISMEKLRGCVGKREVWVLKQKKKIIPSFSANIVERSACLWWLQQTAQKKLLPLAPLDFKSVEQTEARCCRNRWHQRPLVFKKGRGKKIFGVLEFNAKQQLSPLIVPPEWVLEEKVTDFQFVLQYKEIEFNKTQQAACGALRRALILFTAFCIVSLLCTPRAHTCSTPAATAQLNTFNLLMCRYSDFQS